MKRLILTVAVVFVFGVTGAIWLSEVSFQNSDNAPKPVSGVARNRTLEVPSPTANPVQTVQNDSEVSAREDVGKMRQLIEDHNVPINFWGTVVDQDGVPLLGVRVAYTYSVYHGNDQGVAWIDLEMGKGETTSGRDGLFAITDLRGHDLTIESLTKPGYLHRERWQLAYNFYGERPESKFQPRRDKPVRITMIQATATEALVHAKGGVEVRGDGTAEHWNLWSGEADPNGELAVIFHADPGVSATPAQVLNWSADLEVVGGGITEAPWEEDVRRAPESGYLASVFYPKVDQKQGVPHRSFYLRTADGKYGRIQVELSTSHDGRTARCFVSADMNPKPGSRNLEPSEDE